MAKTKKSDRDLITEAEALGEEELQKRLDALRKKMYDVKQKKKEAREKSERITRDGIAEDVIKILGLKVKFEECSDLKSYDEFREMLAKQVQYLMNYYQSHKSTQSHN